MTFLTPNYISSSYLSPDQRKRGEKFQKKNESAIWMLIQFDAATTLPLMLSLYQPPSPHRDPPTIPPPQLSTLLHDHW